MNGRRIAIFTGNYVNVLDGVALTTSRLVGYLRARGDHPLVFGPAAGRGGQHVVEAGSEFVPVPSMTFPVQPEYRVALGMNGAARRRLAAFDPELIHTCTPDRLGCEAVAWARSRGRPAVASFHSNIVSYWRWIPVLRHARSLGWAYLRRFYGRHEQVLVPTDSMVSELRRHGIVNGVRVWPRGVDATRFVPGLHAPRPRPVVLFVARLRREKGLQTLTESLRLLEGTPHESVVVGEGPGLAAMKAALPGTRFTGRLEGDALAAEYANADLFLYPSDSETFGNVVLEAMAAGLPVVGARAPGTRSLIVDGDTGVLCTPGRSDQFARAARALICDPKERIRMGHRARARAETFSWPQTMRRISGYYDEALGRR